MRVVRGESCVWLYFKRCEVTIDRMVRHSTFMFVGLALCVLLGGAGCDERTETLKGPVAVVSGKAPEHGMLGVEFVAEGSRSLEIRDVLPGSEADKAGLVAGERVTSLDGHPVTSFAELVERLRSSRPGTIARLGVSDGAKARLVEVRLMSFGELVALREASKGRP